VGQKQEKNSGQLSFGKVSINIPILEAVKVVLSYVERKPTSSFFTHFVK
jgi:hypothetical protein